MNDTVCHPKWVEGFVEECRNQGFTEKQASVFLEAALQNHMNEPLEKQAFSRLLGRGMLRLGGIGLAGYGAKKLFESGGPGSETWNNLKYNVKAMGDHAAGAWNGVLDGLRLTPPSHAEKDPHARPGTNNSTSSYNQGTNPTDKTQQQTNNYLELAKGKVPGTTNEVPGADARMHYARVQEGYAAAASGNVKKLEEALAYIDNYGSAYIGHPYAKQEILRGLNEWFANVQPGIGGVSQEQYDAMRRIYARVNGH